MQNLRGNEGVQHTMLNMLLYTDRLRADLIKQLENRAKMEGNLNKIMKEKVFLDDQLHDTITSFAVTPVIGLVRDRFEIRPELGEVAEVFSVPLSHVLDPANYLVQSRRWRGSLRHYFTVPYGPYYIWGATARMLREWTERMKT